MANGGQPYGSELGWQGAFIAPASDSGAPADTYSARVALSYLKYLAYVHNPPDTFTLADVRFTDGEFARLNRLGDAIYNANNPDLRAFRDHGGKLILYQGWADPAAPPWATIDYTTAMQRTMGGFAASQRFSRLYLVPGAYHCLFGPDTGNPTELALVELLTPLMDWVERGIPPGAELHAQRPSAAAGGPDRQALRRAGPGQARAGQPQRPLRLHRPLPRRTILTRPAARERSRP